MIDIVSHLEYNAFGKLQGEPDEELAFLYMGKMFDDATQLQWNVNRWYDAGVGRWCSEDPIGFAAGDGNLGRYVGNGVMDNVDPLGEWKESVHNGKTNEWCQGMSFGISIGGVGGQKFTPKACGAIASADAAVDTTFGMGPLPTGDQARHFNRKAYGQTGDTRVDKANAEMDRAYGYCTGNNPTGKINPQEAARHLGYALHSLQDVYAHGDYGREVFPNPILAIHNMHQLLPPGDPDRLGTRPDDPTLDAYNPNTGLSNNNGTATGKDEYIFVPSSPYVSENEYAYYKIGSKRITATQDATTTQLYVFYVFLESNPNALCECRKYFLRTL